MSSLAAAACASGQPGMPPEAPSAGTWSKLSPALRAQAGEGGAASVVVLIRITHCFGDADRHALEGAGLAVQSASCDVVTGRVAERSLLHLTEVPFVMRIEQARPLKPERELP